MATGQGIEIIAYLNYNRYNMFCKFCPSQKCCLEYARGLTFEKPPSVYSTCSKNSSSLVFYIFLVRFISDQLVHTQSN